MILESLWSKKCCLLTLRSEAVLEASSLLKMPILALYNADEDARDITVHFGDDSILPGLTYSEVLEEEIGISDGAEAAVVVFGPKAQLGSKGCFSLVAEIIYAAVLKSDSPSELSLFDWALRSFAPELSVCLDDCDQVLRDFAGVPFGLSEEQCEAYFKLLEPLFVRKQMDPSLSANLSGLSKLDDWLAVLGHAFDKAGYSYFVHE